MSMLFVRCWHLMFWILGIAFWYAVFYFGFPFLGVSIDWYILVILAAVPGILTGSLLKKKVSE